MPTFKRPELAAEARRLNLEQLATLGGEVKRSRARRRMTQQQLADRAGVSRSALSDIEHGRGGTHTLDAWQRIALAAGRPLVVGLQRDALEDTQDAGHLAMQELLLRLGRQAGFGGSFELSTRSHEPWRSTDVGLRDVRRRLLVLLECWNSIGDIGAAARSTTRKVQEAEGFAIAIGGEQPYRVASCWVVRDTRRNRELVRRYPEVFRARFPGSSHAWVRSLTGDPGAGDPGAGDPGARDPRAKDPRAKDPGPPRAALPRAVPPRAALPRAVPPIEPGLIWCDVGSTRLFAWRLR